MLPPEHGGATRGGRVVRPSFLAVAAALVSWVVLWGVPGLEASSRGSVPGLGVLGAPTAASAATDASRPADLSGSADRSRAAYYARQLRKDPLYVSPSLTRIANPAQVAALRRQIAAMPYPTFVVVAPQFDDEPGLERFSDLPALLRDRTGVDGLYVVSDQRGSGFAAEAFGVATRGNIRRIGSTVSDAVSIRDGAIARVRFALDHLRAGVEATRSGAAERAADDARPWWIFGGATLLGLVVPLGGASMTPGAVERRRERRRRRDAARARAAERADDEILAPAPERGAARRAAQERVAELARVIAEAPQPPDAAVRGYDAASTVLGWPKASAVDFVGAETLAIAALAALDGASWRPCFFDPRHGQGTRSTRWRRGAADATLPACEACSRAVDRGTAPASLSDGGRPYWERDGVWARTGFGAIDERVADIVLAGGRSVR